MLRERTLPDPLSFPAVAEPAHGIHSFLEVGEGLRWPVLKAVPSFRQSSPCCPVLVSHSQENTYVTGRSGDVSKRRLRRTVRPRPLTTLVPSDYDHSLLWFHPTTTTHYFGSIRQRPRPTATLVPSDHDQSLLWFIPTTTSHYFGSTLETGHKTGGCLYLTKSGSWHVACLWLRLQRILIGKCFRSNDGFCC